MWIWSVGLWFRMVGGYRCTCTDEEEYISRGAYVYMSTVYNCTYIEVYRYTGGTGQRGVEWLN